MELRINNSNAKALLESAGRTLDDLKSTGRIDLSASAYLVASCNPSSRHRVYSFTLVEVSHEGGKNLVNLVESQSRELLYAAHYDSEGNSFTERQASEAAARNEQFKQAQFRQRLLSA